MGEERPLASVPRPVRIAVVMAFSLQLLWHALQPPPVAIAGDLPPPPPPALLALAAVGEPVLLAKSLMLWLQAFDNQPGLSVPFAKLDYDRVAVWLERILNLDPRAQYPLLAASRLYAEVAEPERQRRMLRFVYEAFRSDPRRRWQWLAHAVFIAKHRLGDLKLALRYADDLAEMTAPGTAPAWARQMRVFLLEDMDEFEAAKVLLGGLLASGEVTDPAEYRFLNQRLQEIEARARVP